MMTSATSRKPAECSRESLPLAGLVEHQTPGRPKARPKEKDPTHHYPFIFFFFLIGNQVPKAERVYFSGAARRDDDTSTVLSTAVTSPEAEERGVKTTSYFSATGSKPTGPSAPSRPTLLCLGHEVPT